MRLVDFCNPHFKDEHPSRAWIPALALENRASSRHPVRFARLDRDAEVAIHHDRIAGAETLTPPVIRQRIERKPNTPLNQDRFDPQPVKVEGFHGPRRLSPAGGPPQTLPPDIRCRTTGF